MQPKTILIADDELRIRKLVADFLLREGYTVLEAENGTKALALLETEKIDLVILDVMMPEQDGLSVCREIRKKSSIPVIMLTARGEEIDQLFNRVDKALYAAKKEGRNQVRLYLVEKY